MADKSERARPDSLRPLLQEHHSLRDALEASLRRCSELADDGGDAERADERCGGQFDRLLSHLGGLLSEAARRGVPDWGADVEFRGLGRADVGLDPAGALATSPGAAAAWRRRAAKGQPAAQYLLGQTLVFGGKSPEQVDEGLKWLERAARADYAPAALALGVERLTRPGENRDADRGLRLLQQAADLGLGEAHWRLANAAPDPARGESATKKTLDHLGRAAELGHPEAALDLGRIHAVGAEGVAVDHARAKQWLLRAADAHRKVASDWLERYGDVSAEAYPDLAWLDAWTPDQVPGPPPAGWLSKAISAGVLLLLVAGTIKGNTVALFLLVASIVVLLHEFGHLLAARMLGIPIAVFTIGAGPVVRSFRVARGPLPMLVVLRLLPLMGSVQPHVAPRGVWEHWQERWRRQKRGEPPPPVPNLDRDEPPLPVSLHRTPGDRLAYLGGGLAVNLLAAIGALWAYEIASPLARRWTSPVAGPVPAESVAARSGIETGDRFLAVDGRPVRGFYDVQRRLAPVDRANRAVPTADPPGGVVRLTVRRDDRELELSWRTPDALPPGDARTAYGLFPARNWVLVRPWQGIVPSLQAGDRVDEYDHGVSPVSTLRREAAAGFPEACKRGTSLLVTRAGRGFVVDIPPGTAPPEFEIARETGPARGLGEVVGRVFTWGWKSVIALPTSIIESFAKRPTAEEQSALANDLRRDPWEFFRFFAWVNAFVLFLNFVPIPPLDGFQLTACVVEIVRRRPLPLDRVVVVHRVGWVLLGVWLALNAALILRDLAIGVL